MTDNQQKRDEWNDCPTGELRQMVGRLKATQQRARSKQLFSIASACMLLVGGGIFVIGSLLDTGSLRYGGISCSECQANFAAYHDFKNEAASLDDSLATSMAAHLEQCQFCRNLFEQTYPGILSSEQPRYLTAPVFAVASATPSY
jgi:hypothetical protein